MRSVTDPGGGQSAFTEEVRRLFLERLHRRTDVALEPPAWLPTDPAAMSLELARREVRAYEADVQIMSLEQHVAPSPIDPTRRVVSVDIKIRLLGNSLPTRALKIGGTGEASTSVLIGDGIDVEMVQRRLRQEVTNAALDEAIAMTEKKVEMVIRAERSPARFNERVARSTK
jgi:hypothetical protein